MKNIIKHLTIALLAISVMSFTFIQGNWERLGTRIVNMKADHDVIPVSMSEGVFTKLKFNVKKAPIYVRNIRVVFGNGKDMNLKIDRKFAPGSESRVLDLPGNKRIIKKIVLNYKSVPTPKGRAVVTAFGRR